MNYIRWFPGDYLRDTLHLTWYEDLAYRRLLDVYYTLEKPLPADRELLYKLIRANTAEQRKAVEKVLAEFFTEYGPKSHRFFSQVRARAEVKSYQNWRKQAVLNGRKGGRPKKLADDQKGLGLKTSPKPAPKPAQNHPPPPLPPPTPEESAYSQLSQDHARSPIHANGDEREFPGFSLFWQAYPIQEAKIKARYQWITNGLEPHTAAVLESLEKWKLCERWKDPQYIPQACRWIAERRWTEQPFTRPKTKSLIQQLTELETKMELERKAEHDRSRKPPELH